MSATAIIASGLLSLGLLIGLLQEAKRYVLGGNPDYLSPILRFTAFVAILGSYGAFYGNIVGVVSGFGSLDSSSDQVVERIKSRWRGYQEKENERETLDEAVEKGDGVLDTFNRVGEVLGKLTAETIYKALLSVSTYFSFIATFAIVNILKYIQQFMLAIAFAWGPVCIGFAALHPFFNSLTLSWFWTTVEVTAWGVTMKMLLGDLVKMDKELSARALDAWQGTRLAMDRDLSLAYGDHMIINGCYILMLLGVPVITSMFIRSAAAASSSSSTVARGRAAASAVKSAVKSGGGKIAAAGAVIGAVMPSSGARKGD